MTSIRELSCGRNITVSVVTTLFGELYQLPMSFQHIPSWIDEVVLVAEADIKASERLIEVIPPRVQVIQRSAHRRQSALVAGLKAATGDIIVVMAGDGSHDPSEIPLLCDKLCAGADYVIASRFCQGGKSTQMRLLRRFRNHTLTTVANVLFGGHFTDLCYGYFAFWQYVLPALALEEEDGYDDDNLKVAFNLRALRYGHKIVEVPSHQREPFSTAAT